MKKVKIYGAGSIGNHLAHASRSLGFEVLICDVDPLALKRTREEIYPGRYGKWDNGIRLSLVQDMPREAFDVVFIGTPPDSHIELALKILKEETPEVLLIEKPLCTPDLKDAQTLYELAERSDTSVCVGYNHALGKNTVEAERLLRDGAIGDPFTIYGGFQEYWGGIFKAHPWLAGPSESYLGFASRGGGACGEHSHAINIWQHFAHVLDLGRITEVAAFMDFVEDGTVAYDRICNINVRTEKGYPGTIVQDVITEPSNKYMRIQGKDGFLEWHVNWSPEGDAVISGVKDRAVDTMVLPKKRPDDFICEMEHVSDIMDGTVTRSPISLERGLDTMMVIAAAYLSDRLKKVMEIDYSRGYMLDSIRAVQQLHA